MADGVASEVEVTRKSDHPVIVAPFDQELLPVTANPSKFWV